MRLTFLAPPIFATILAVASDARAEDPDTAVRAAQAEQPSGGVTIKTPVWITGLVAFGIGWEGACIGSLAGLTGPMDPESDEDERGDYLVGLVPLAGPFMVADSGNISDGARAGFVVLGVAQHLGLAMTVTGLSLPSDLGKSLAASVSPTGVEARLSF